MTTPPPPEGWSPAPRPGETPVPRGRPPQLYGPPPPPPPPLFDDAWPEEDVPTRPALLVGALAIGVLAGLILPEHFAVSVAGFLVAAGLLLVPVAFSTHRAAPYTWVAAALTAALFSLLVFRAAGWLAALALAVGALLVFSALNGARTVADLGLAALTWIIAVFRAVPWVRRTSGEIRRLPVGWPVVRTAALCVVALVVFGALFATGDAVFGSWVQALLPRFDGALLVTRALVAAAVSVLAVGAFYTAINPPSPAPAGRSGPRRTPRRFEWLAPLVVVIAMFGGFVAAQATTMWAGHDYVQRTAGVTYAESVHRGFGQLTVATLLALLVVGVTWWYAPRESAADRLVLSAALGVLCSLALVVVASALYRMHVYQQAYGFTVLRLLVDAFELWMGLLLVLTMLAVAIRAVAMLPRAALVSAALVVLGLGVMNPEAWVAQHNVDRYRDSGKIDAAYLSGLGPDARPAIADGLPADLARCIVRNRPRASAPIEWNLGRDRAHRSALDSARGTGECTSERAVR
ncbi:DUF4153 domain-containing protein [Tsukamurella sp. 1534]|uniref:DUF4153 domain-containing protein n=1 Tax=Tsukamurella sp. 1534 TaxID=1151061 RepID=UPI0002F2134A|nr:DUF4173 domain-containing protein [Tsukamurella sp. 1534]